jgi:crotonobetainyl-CoA:carnitine CoA-transferase CaiB-like acyl-CoA transferase
MPHEKHGADMLSFPTKFQGETLPAPDRAPTVGQHGDMVLREVLGYSDEKIQALLQSGALGKPRG